MAASTEDHLLCTLPFAEPKQFTDQLKKKYPGLKITYRNLGDVRWDIDQIEDDVYEDVTIIATLAALPSQTAVAPKLGFVHICSAGTNHLENAAVFQDRSITFTNSSGIHAPNIGEWIVMVMLVHSRNYRTLHDWQREHTWGKGQNQESAFSRSSDNVGKKLAILGYGSIGRQAARLCKALGMDVIAYTASPRDTPESRKDDGYWVPGVGDPQGEIPSQWFSGTEKKDLHRFLDQDIDYLLISLPLTKKTKYLIGKEEFGILGKKHTFVINVARGDVLVQDELINALRAFENSDGKEGIRGAAVDVTTPEPLPKDSELWAAPNIIVTPHISGVSRDYVGRCFQVLDRNIERWQAGKRLLNVVDREKGYSSNASN